LSGFELETRYEAAADPVGKSHFHALWLLSLGYEVDEVAEILSFSPRWVPALIKRYNESWAILLGSRTGEPFLAQRGAVSPSMTVAWARRGERKEGGGRGSRQNRMGGIEIAACRLEALTRLPTTRAARLRFSPSRQFSLPKAPVQ